ncbi:Ig-like domain-containing protein [Tychonema sp. BBK16]|uniref:Ig-like domain-containing protein n=1 Tax=Tychonema sp. BBK16 TaxID=2699888 RepID=UPI001F269609|nr:Ig-like domain-containing protein [Tychonema sp. BBK16]
MLNFINSVIGSIVFLDSALPDIQNLCNGIAAGIEVIIVDRARDGVAQITEVLGSRSNIKSIHIISHGRSASLQLGAIDLNLTNLKKYGNQLQRWSAALAESSEILLYGCEVAAGDAGANFVRQISLLTKAKIAASRSPVGSAAKGGDWLLDYTIGSVESELAIDQATMAAYQYVFGRTLYDGTNYSPLPPTSAPIPGIGTAAGTQLAYGQVPLPAPLGSGLLPAGAYSPNTGINTASVTAFGDVRGYAGYTNYKYTPPSTFAQLNASFPALNRTNGYSVSFNVAVTAEASNSNDRAGFSIISISSDAQTGIELGFTNRNLGPNGGIFAQNGGASPTLFTRGENAGVNISAATDYKLIVQGNTYTLFAGGVAIPNLTNQPLRNYTAFNPETSQPALPYNPYSQPNFLFFGDATDQASANFTLGPISVNNLPIAQPDTYNVLHDKVLFSNPSVLKNDTDADLDSLTTVLATGPTKGTIFLDPLGNFTYTPNAGFFGLDTFTYNVSDGAAIVPATVNINVTNSLPIAQPDNYSISAGKALNITAPGVLANDSDADLDTLTAALSANPTKGAIALNKDGSFTYTPNAGFAGTDTFTYTVSDGIVNSASATVTVNVNNNPPVAIADSYTTAFNTPLNVAGLGVLINDTDAENDPLTAILVAGPTKGAIALNANGSFSYTPNAAFAGTDSFTYKANDGKADSAIATASIIVNNPTSPTPTSPTPTSPTPTSPTPTSPTPTSPTPTSPTPTSPTPTSPTPTSPTPTSPTPTSPTPTSPTPTSPTPTSPTPTSPTPTSPTPTSPTPTSPTPTSPTPTSPTPTSPTPTSPTPTSPTPTIPTSTSPTPTSPTPTSPTPTIPTPTIPTPTIPTPTSPTPTSPTPTIPTPTSPTPTIIPVDSDSVFGADRDCICEEITLPAIGSIPRANSVDRTFNGTDRNDFLIGSNLNDAINGFNGNDILLGQRGNDNIYGGLPSNVPIDTNTDDDLLSGGNGNDYLNGNAGNDLIFGGKGNDVAIGGKDDDLIWGDKGNDTLVGYQGNDCLFGGTFDPFNPDSNGRDLLFGDEGNDFLNGGDAADSLSGGEGDDTVYGGKGDDVLVGGSGDDLLLGDRGSDRICGGDGDDTIFGESAIGLNGEPDSLCGGEGNDLMFGNGGFDELCGDRGNDTIYGGKGDDSVAGGIGDDWLIGGLGKDTLQGGSGRDYFILTAGQGDDLITDFTKGEDLLVLTGGLKFDRLSIIQDNKSTLIKIANTGQLIAVLNGVSVGAIGQQDFTII